MNKNNKCDSCISESAAISAESESFTAIQKLERKNMKSLEMCQSGKYANMHTCLHICSFGNYIFIRIVFQQTFPLIQYCEHKQAKLYY